MEVSHRPIEPGKIQSIVEKRLVHAPQEAKTAFPAVLQLKQVSWITITEPLYFMIVFLTPEERERINELVIKRLNPFPGLITTGSEGAVFRVTGSRYVAIRKCTVSDAFALSARSDSTIIVEDHSQSINSKGIGIMSYKIPLAYVLS